MIWLNASCGCARAERDALLRAVKLVLTEWISETARTMLTEAIQAAERQEKP